MNNSKKDDVILVVEDNLDIAGLVAKYLANAGYEVVVIRDGADALEAFHQHRPLLAILDIMLPGIDGWQICREVRRVSNVPLLILSARDEEFDRVLGFALGADDYVVKPFSPRELVERVKAVLRRARPTPRVVSTTLRFGSLVLEPEKRKVTRNNQRIALTPSEYSLLHAMMAAPGRVFSRDELLDRLGQRGDMVIDRVIDVHIGKLRKKIESDPSSPTYIQTVHGIGYQFTEVKDG